MNRGCKLQSLKMRLRHEINRALTVLQRRGALGGSVVRSRALSFGLLEQVIVAACFLLCCGGWPQ